MRGIAIFIIILLAVFTFINAYSAEQSTSNVDQAQIYNLFDLGMHGGQLWIAGFMSRGSACIFYRSRSDRDHSFLPWVGIG